jgi:hypothetical protein
MKKEENKQKKNRTDKKKLTKKGRSTEIKRKNKRLQHK